MRKQFVGGPNISGKKSNAFTGLVNIFAYLQETELITRKEKGEGLTFAFCGFFKSRIISVLP